MVGFMRVGLRMGCLLAMVLANRKMGILIKGSGLRVCPMAMEYKNM